MNDIIELLHEQFSAPSNLRLIRLAIVAQHAYVRIAQRIA
jgi:hypothetical protein